MVVVLDLAVVQNQNNNNNNKHPQFINLCKMFFFQFVFKAANNNYHSLTRTASKTRVRIRRDPPIDRRDRRASVRAPIDR